MNWSNGTKETDVQDTVFVSLPSINAIHEVETSTTDNKKEYEIIFAHSTQHVSCHNEVWWTLVAVKPYETNFGCRSATTVSSLNCCFTFDSWSERIDTCSLDVWAALLMLWFYIYRKRNSVISRLYIMIYFFLHQTRETQRNHKQNLCGRYCTLRSALEKNKRYKESSKIRKVNSVPQVRIGRNIDRNTDCFRVC